jgi:hypothetical protein
MKHLTGTKKQCDDYNSKVTSQRNYKGATTQWGFVRKHPNKNFFAISYAEDVEPDGGVLVDSLGDNWNDSES